MTYFLSNVTQKFLKLLKYPDVSSVTNSEEELMQSALVTIKATKAISEL
jgi:hypothetical protein